ncbi:MAG: lysophosphatidic acid acyltransferase [Porticoccaceae bacterium]|nr:MAG: lysophosphatidic acid acyltransferase [Porticoccaceae bacterium]
MKAWLALRSALFYAGYAVLVVVFGLLVCTVGLLLPIGPRQALASVGNGLVLQWLRLTCGVRFVVEGAEHIPRHPFVAVSNHQSPWETYYLQRALRPVSTILKRELLRIPFFGWGLWAVRPIVIDRAQPKRAARQVLEQGKQRIAAGLSVVVYPEGTRIPHGQFGSYARSAAALAIACGVPLLPVAHNAGRHWPARRFLKYPGTITVVFGKPLAPEGDARALTERARLWIQAEQRRIG